MAFGWIKKLGVIGKAVIEVGAKLDPKHFGPVELMVEAVEEALPKTSGADKKASVETVANVALAQLQASGVVTAEQVEAAKALRSKLIDSYVAYRNAETAYAETKEAYEVLMASFQPKS